MPTKLYLFDYFFDFFGESELPLHINSNYHQHRHKERVQNVFVVESHLVRVSEL